MPDRMSERMADRMRGKMPKYMSNICEDIWLEMPWWGSLEVNSNQYGSPCKKMCGHTTNSLKNWSERKTKHIRWPMPRLIAWQWSRCTSVKFGNVSVKILPAFCAAGHPSAVKWRNISFKWVYTQGSASPNNGVASSCKPRSMLSAMRAA